MKSFWKWALGIVIAVAVTIAAVFGVRYLISNGYIRTPAGFAWHDRTGRGFDNQRGPKDFKGWNSRAMLHDRYHHFDRFSPMGRRSGFGLFGMTFMFIGGLFRLAFFGALLYGAYWLGKRNARVILDPVPLAPAEPVESPKSRTRKVAKS
jgi:hypothetical protein